MRIITACMALLLLSGCTTPPDTSYQESMYNYYSKPQKETKPALANPMYTLPRVPIVTTSNIVKPAP